VADRLRTRFSSLAPVFKDVGRRSQKTPLGAPLLAKIAGSSALMLPMGTPTTWFPLDKQSGILARYWKVSEPFAENFHKIPFSPWAVPEEQWQRLDFTLDVDATCCLCDSVSHDVDSDESNALRAKDRLRLKLPAGTYVVERVASYFARRHDELDLIRLRPEGHAAAAPKRAPKPPPLESAVPLSAASRAVGKQLRFIDTEGGPFVAVPRRALAAWFGTNDADGEYAYEKQPTDYDRACQGNGARVLRVAKEEALVLDGPSSTAFLPERRGGVFITWEGADRASDLVQALGAVKQWKRLRSEFHFAGGALVVFDSASDGRELGRRDPQLEVRLAKGSYRLETGTALIDVADGKAVRTANGSYVRLTRT
jgi:hypothetical protein